MFFKERRTEQKKVLVSISVKALTSANNIFTLRANALGYGRIMHEVTQGVYHVATAATHPLR